MIFKNKKIAIIGHGIEGLDAEEYLKSKGAITTILDQKDDSNYLNNLNSYDLIVRSPGVYPYKKELVKVKEKGVKVTTPTSIFFEEFKGKIIGVTGTKGKGTTSTLIYEILKNANYDVHLAGNIGKAPLKLIESLNEKSIVILEMSSFQLIDLSYSPHISVVLNITSDHMDWHKDVHEYINAKKNIVKFQTKDDWAVINSEYETSKQFAKETKANIVFFDKNNLDLKYTKDLMLRGKHNLENVAAAVSVGHILKIDEEVILNTLKNFKGLEHRLEFVKEVDDCKYYNDSFATGPQPTMAAIKSFDEDQTVIMGGSDKFLDYAELGDLINKTQSVKNVILIGTTADKIKKHLKPEGKFKIFELGFPTMKEIVLKAKEVTSKNGVVVLSPASASFDMFKDYKDRGNQFKEEVKKL